jgi:hypothetical protein
MEGSFSAAVGEWNDFYTFLGTSSATLLGLLFVALSLRLNIFHQRNVADVRDFAFQTFADFVFVVLISVLFLIPNQSKPGVALPLASMAVVGIAWMAYLARESVIVNEPPATVFGWQWTYYLGLAVLHLAMLIVAVVLWTGHTGALYWLAAIAAGLLATAVLNAWILLSHARTDSDA